MKEATIRFRCSKILKAALTKLAAAKEQTLSDFVRAEMVALAAKDKHPNAEYPYRPDPAAIHAAEDPPRSKKHQKAG